MKLFPIIEIVQIDRVARRRSVIGKRVRRKNSFTRVIVMEVSSDRRVQLIDRSLVQPHTWLLANPGLKLRVGRTLLLDEINDRLTLESEAVDDHLIVAFSRSGISCGQFASCLQ